MEPFNVRGGNRKGAGDEPHAVTSDLPVCRLSRDPILGSRDWEFARLIRELGIKPAGLVFFLVVGAWRQTKDQGKEKRNAIRDMTKAVLLLLLVSLWFLSPFTLSPAAGAAAAARWLRRGPGVMGAGWRACKRQTPLLCCVWVG